MISKSFRKKMGKAASLYDGVYEHLGDLRVVLPSAVPSLTVKEAEVLRHNIAVLAALHGQRWARTVIKELAWEV